MKQSPHNLNRPNKIVLTGGPGVGKTSILKYLESLNYDIREEVFTRIFKEAQLSGTFNELFLKSKGLLENLITSQKQIESQPAKSQFIFLDRSRVDILGYCKNIDIDPPQEHLRWLTQNEYDLTFIIEPLPEKFYDQNSVRRQTQIESLDHHNKIIQHYNAFAIQNNLDINKFVITVPYMEGPQESSIRLRAQYILDRIG